MEVELHIHLNINMQIGLNIILNILNKPIKSINILIHTN